MVERIWAVIEEADAEAEALAAEEGADAAPAEDRLDFTVQLNAYPRPGQAGRDLA